MENEEDLLTEPEVPDQPSEFCDTDGKCYSSEKTYNIDALKGIWAFFDTDNDKKATKKELQVAFKKIAGKNRDYINPIKMFSMTWKTFDGLCSAPEYKAYYVKHLMDEDYYAYGSERLFERLK